MKKKPNTGCRLLGSRWYLKTYSLSFAVFSAYSLSFALFPTIAEAATHQKKSKTKTTSSALEIHLTKLTHADEGVRQKAVDSLIPLLNERGAPEAFTRALQHCEASLNDYAILQLLKQEKEALPILQLFMNDPRASIREKIIHGVGPLKQPETITLLIRGIEDPDPMVRRWAVNWVYPLGSAGYPAIPTLLRLLKTEKVMDVRQAIILVLRFTSHLDAIEALADVLQHDIDPHMRDAALQGLRVIQSPEQTLPHFIKSLEDPDLQVRVRAVDCLGQGRKPEAVPALTKALQDSHSMIRGNAFHQLIAFNDPTTLPALVRALGESNAGSRQSKIDALLSWHVKEAPLGPALIEALEHQNPLARLGAVEALGAYKDPQAVPALKRALNDPEESVRTAAHHALDELGITDEIRLKPRK